MEKLWTGRSSGKIDELAEMLNSSIGVDKKMVSQDIRGSVAHAKMLAKVGIISADDAVKIVAALEKMLAEISDGRLKIGIEDEDIHSFVERTLVERIGDVGKMLHTARSRNDQVAQDLRLYLREEIAKIGSLLADLAETAAALAESNKTAIMPGYTHLQRAQPVSFAHHILAYAMMFLRDIGRLDDCKKRLNVSPIGSCALAGTTYAIDRDFEAAELGFDSVCLNSIDGVSDRDFALELAADLAIIQVHLSRLAEELVLWSSFEFRFVELSDAFTTGSSIMPQKKNPDMAELIRGKTGRVCGDLANLLMMLKGLPLAYDKDMQEDKEAIFDSVETVELCLEVMRPMLSTMRVNAAAMKAAAQTGFINATDLADYLVRKGVPFRDAYRISGKIVAWCTENGKILENLELSDYQKFSPLFADDVFDAINIENCMERRNSKGGTSRSSVEMQIAAVRSACCGR